MRYLSSFKKLPIFVIHEHHASHDHYDLRLEFDGALKSWALPKTPPLISNIKRLAIPTEDHTYAYRNFEGHIPEGHYGAGEVSIWDKGEYENLYDESLENAYQNGKIKIKLYGKKLPSDYMLIRTNLSYSSKKQVNWLFIKIKTESSSEKIASLHNPAG